MEVEIVTEWEEARRKFWLKFYRSRSYISSFVLMGFRIKLLTLVGHIMLSNSRRMSMAYEI